MNHWRRRDEGSSDTGPAGFPKKRGPKPKSQPSPVRRRGGRSFPERCDPFGELIPLTEHQRCLATQYMPLAQSLAKGYRFRRLAEREELESTAYMALVEAAQMYDATRKVNFATYARHRIRGALRDYQRHTQSADWRGDEAERPVFQRLKKGAEDSGRVIGMEPSQPIGADIEAVEAVEEWLRRLPQVHATACRLIYIHGESQNNVAASVGCSRSFLSRLHREAISMLIMDYEAARAAQQHKTEPSE